MCKLCCCRFRALHLHGKSINSKILFQFLQSIRAQLLPLEDSSVIDPVTTPSETRTTLYTVMCYIYTFYFFILFNKVQMKLRHGNMHKSQKEIKKNTGKFQAI